MATSGQRSSVYVTYSIPVLVGSFHIMTEQTSTAAGKCFPHYLVEERAVGETGRSHGVKDLITENHNVKMETATTYGATYVSPEKFLPAFELRGTRRELLERRLSQKIREEVLAELELAPPPTTEFLSTTQRDFCAQGFVPCRLRTAKDRDYKTEQAITFWSQNCQKVQGVTPIRNPKAPFKKSTLFSKPISEQLDDF
ncbi:sperm-associated antigen 8 isoform X1 [Nothobranchius furzeri]|uniref:Sperm associated antigen 8 n=4 Tax=Nothobranchius TaxID=28779 RepID=A0A1A8AEX3_NOTFU